MPDKVERRLAAILAADVVGYSRMMAADEEGTRARLGTLRANLIDPAIAENRGRIVKLMGDGMLVEFASVVDAVRCAAEIQRAMAEQNEAVPEDQRIVLRVGVNTGDVIVEGDDIHGDGVNIAARLEGLADPGGVMISGIAFDQVRDRLELTFEDLGEQTVKNIPRPVRVYRLVLDPTAVGETSGAAPTRVGFAKRWRWAIPAAAAVMVMGVAAGVLLSLEPWLPSVEAADPAKMAYALPDKRSIAVLPFENHSDDPTQDWFAEGIADDLITDLSKIPDLFVIARNSSFAYKERTVKLREVAEELGVKYLVEGSVRRAGDKLRINAQLIDVVSGKYLWAERYDGSSADIFALQDEVTGDIAKSLVTTLSPEDIERHLVAETSSVAAYDAFTEGWQSYRQRTPESLAKAVFLFKKALELDPEYARASAALAASYAIAYENFWERYIGETITNARYKQFAWRNAALKKPSPFVYRVAAVVSLGNRETDQALEYAERALELDPNDPDSHMAMARALIYSDRAEEGLDHIETAMRINPNEPDAVIRLQGMAYWVLKDYKKSAEILETWLADHSTDWLSAMYLAVAQAQLGQNERAGVAYGRFSSVFESSIGWPPSYLGGGLWRLRQRHPDMWSAIDSDPRGDFKQGLTSAALAYTISQTDVVLESLLSGEEIRRLLFGQTQILQASGTRDESEFRYEESGRFSASGFWFGAKKFQGVAELAENKLCLYFEDGPDPGSVCGFVLPSSPGEPSDQTHNFVSSAGVLPFSVWEFGLPDKPSIAVLPFTNMSDDSDQEWFADGMTDDLITDLSKISSLFVIARNSSFTYKGQAVDIRRVGRELGVKYVLEGSVRRHDRQIRINAQLIDATTGAHLWAERYDGAAADVFALQDRVIAKIVASLAIALGPGDEDPETSSIAAYDAFMEGWQKYRERTPENIAEAASLFKKALELDPEYARASAALAAAYVTAYNKRWEQYIGEPVHKLIYKPLALIDAALMKPTPLAYRVAASSSLRQKDPDEALKYAERALELDPNDPDGHLGMAEVLLWSGRPQEANVHLKQAIRLDPNERETYRPLLGLAALELGEYEKAANLFEESLANDPSDYVPAMHLAIARARLGQDDAAASAYATYTSGYAALNGGQPFSFSEIQGFLYHAPLYLRHESDDRARYWWQSLTTAALAHTVATSNNSLEDRLSETEIRRLLLGRTQVFREPQLPAAYQVQYERSGHISRSGFYGKGRGHAEFEDDKLCLNFREEAFTNVICGFVVPSRTAGPSDDSHLFISSVGVLPFSVWQHGLPDKPSLAVLPFNNLSGDPDQEYFVDGMTETLITDLSRIPELFVIARNTSFTYKGKAVDVRQVGRELGVRYVVEGSVQRAGGRVRINAQLIDTQTGGHIWSDRFDRAYEDIFALQDEAVSKIIAALPVIPSQPVDVDGSDAPTTSLEAYDLYLRGVQTMHNLDRQDLERSVAMFELALEVDPDFAHAYAGLAQVNYDLAIHIISDDPQADILAWNAAEHFAHTAIRLDPDLAAPYAVLAQLKLSYPLRARPHEEAIELVEKAIALASDDPDILVRAADVLTIVGEVERALRNIESAYRLNPKPPPSYAMQRASVLFQLDRYEEAVKSANLFREQVPISQVASELLAPAYAYLGDLIKARAHVDRILELDPDVTLIKVTSWFAYKRAEQRGRYIEGFRLAGLPLFESGAEPPGDRLSSAEIKALLDGQVIAGQDFVSGIRWWYTQEVDGKARRRDSDENEGTGTFTIDDGWACWTWDLPDDFQRCSRVYRDPQGSSDRLDEYLLAGMGCGILRNAAGALDAGVRNVCSFAVEAITAE